MLPLRTRTFAGRLSQLIIITLFITMATIALVIYGITRNAMSIEANNRYHGLMDVTNERLNNVLTSVELAAGNNVPDIEDNLDNPQRVSAVLREIVLRNPVVVGCGLGYEPDHFPSMGRWFELYASRPSLGNSVEVEQIGSLDHDYLFAEWYSRATAQDSGYWSHPYFDNAGGKMLMFTYSVPVHDADGKVVAVFGTDISLDWLQEQLHQIDMKMIDEEGLSSSTPESRVPHCFIIGSDGTFIVHPHGERVLKDNFITLAAATPDTTDNFIGREMLGGRAGAGQLDIAGTPSNIYYAPLEHAGWSMAIVVPRHTFYRRANTVGAIILLLMALAIGMAFLVCHRAIKNATLPLTRFAASAGEVAKGNFDTQLPHITTHDEIGLLRDSFEEMQHSLSRYMEDLKISAATQASMERDLKIASSIQQSMLPKKFPPYPERNDIDIYGQLTPAKAVGGDFYDFFIRDDKLFFCIGDVSGKGVPAALVMSVMRTLFRSISAHEDKPEAITAMLNDAMTESRDSSMFVTFFLGVLELSSGLLSYCNAGHESPMLIVAGLGWLPRENDVALGLMPDWNYTSQEAIVKPGTTIFLYTDGLTEAEDIKQRQFGEARLLSAIRPLLAGGNHIPVALIDSVTRAVHEFAGSAEQSDDLTLFAIQYMKPDTHPVLRRAITLDSNVREITRMASFIEDVSRNAGLDDVTTMQISLAIEEAVVNIMNYAYPQGTRGKIRIDAIADTQRLELVITDTGKPFDPTMHSQADINQGATERPLGGLGIHLVRKMMDCVEYRRVDNRNILTLSKRLNSND